MFYGLIAFEKLSLPMCDSDPKQGLVGHHVQTLMKIAFFTNLSTILISSTLFPYFDIYMNTMQLNKKDKMLVSAYDPGNRTQQRMSMLYPYVCILEILFRMMFIALGIL